MGLQGWLQQDVVPKAAGHTTPVSVLDVQYLLGRTLLSDSGSSSSSSLAGSSDSHPGADGLDGWQGADLGGAAEPVSISVEAGSASEGISVVHARLYQILLEHATSVSADIAPMPYLSLAPTGRQRLISTIRTIPVCAEDSDEGEQALGTGQAQQPVTASAWSLDPAQLRSWRTALQARTAFARARSDAHLLRQGRASCTSAAASTQVWTVRLTSMQRAGRAGRQRTGALGRPGAQPSPAAHRN